MIPLLCEERQTVWTQQQHNMSTPPVQQISQSASTKVWKLMLTRIKGMKTKMQEIATKLGIKGSIQRTGVEQITILFNGNELCRDQFVKTIHEAFFTQALPIVTEEDNFLSTFDILPTQKTLKESIATSDKNKTESFSSSDTESSFSSSLSDHLALDKYKAKLMLKEENKKLLWNRLETFVDQLELQNILILFAYVCEPFSNQAIMCAMLSTKKDEMLLKIILLVLPKAQQQQQQQFKK